MTHTSKTRSSPERRNPFLTSSAHIQDWARTQSEFERLIRAINALAEKAGLVGGDTAQGSLGGAGTGGSGGGTTAPTVDLLPYTRRDGSQKPSADWDFNNKSLSNVNGLQAKTIELDGEDLADWLGYLENYAWLMG